MMVRKDFMINNIHYISLTLHQVKFNDLLYLETVVFGEITVSGIVDLT
jgi:hypothetical protein